jgi:hypothetical protein
MRATARLRRIEHLTEQILNALHTHDTTGALELLEERERELQELLREPQTGQSEDQEMRDCLERIAQKERELESRLREQLAACEAALAELHRYAEAQDRYRPRSSDGGWLEWEG